MQLDATNRTPAVSVSSTGIEMKGECYPEDITAFAEPVMQSLRNQLESVESFKARIELYYFNSSSAKFLFDFFEELEEAAEVGKQISVDWCYRADDSSMQEAGEDFEKTSNTLNINLSKSELTPRESFHAVSGFPQTARTA